MKPYEPAALLTLLVLSLGGCGGGGGDTGGPPTTYAVGGTVTGLNEVGLVLENGAMTVAVPAGASAFAFADAVPNNTQYAVTVRSQPSREACHVIDGRGTVKGGTVTSIRVSCGTPTLTALAGNFGGAGNADGTGRIARFNLQSVTNAIDYSGGFVNSFITPGAVAVDILDNVYVADNGNNSIRRITPQGAVTTLLTGAGFGANAGTTGSTASFGNPTGVATDAAGNILVADSATNSIGRITPSGTVTTFASGFSFVRDFMIPTLGEHLEGYGSVATDIAGNVYAGDCGNFVVRKISPLGVVTTFAGQVGTPGSVDTIPGQPDSALFGCPIGVATDASGTVYVVDSPVIVFPDIVGSSGVRKISPAGVVTSLTGGAGGSGIAVDNRGIAVDNLSDVYVADSWSNSIEKISPTGSVTSLAGMAGTPGNVDGIGVAARFNAPASVALDHAGNILVADSGNNTIRKITPAGAVTTLAGAATESGNANGTGAVARFSNPVGLAADNSGYVYVADSSNNAIRRVAPTGVVTSLSSVAGPGPWNLAADAVGNLYVVTLENGYGTILKITPAGASTTLAGQAADFAFVSTPSYIGEPLAYAGAVATDAAGSVYVTDTFNDTIRKITPAGIVTTLAGTNHVKGTADGNGTAAQFCDPQGIATDGAANLYVADAGNNTIRKITAAGAVTTLAGTAGVTGSADGRGSAARFNRPSSLAVDESGNIYVADTGNNIIRKVTPDGVVTTVLGIAGISGFDPGPLPGVISRPLGLAISGASLYVTSANGVAVVDHFP